MFIDIDAAHSGNEAQIPDFIFYSVFIVYHLYWHTGNEARIPNFILIHRATRPNLPAAVHYIKSVIFAGRNVQARFLNDFHGSGKQPNAQFWPYFDERTGEKRMGVKTIAQIKRGQARHATCRVDPRRA